MGLNLFENRLENVHVVFAAGTGINPFVDLIAFVLRYAVHKISKDNFGIHSNMLMANEAESFNQIVSDNFQLHLYLSIRDRLSAIFLDVCEELANLDRKYSLNIFKLHAIITSETGKDHKMNENFMLSQFDLIRNSIRQFYIVGPIGYMDDIRQSLINSGISNTEKIFLV